MSLATSPGKLTIFKNKHTNKVAHWEAVDHLFLGQGAQIRHNSSCLGTSCSPTNVAGDFTALSFVLPFLFPLLCALSHIKRDGMENPPKSG